MAQNRGAPARTEPDAPLQTIIDLIPILAWTATPDGFVDFINRRWLEYTGLTAQDALGWAWAEAIHPDDRNALFDFWYGLLASGDASETETRVRRFDGEYRWFLIRVNAQRDDSGRVIKWFGTNIEIEDRRRAEQAMRASEQNFRLIVDSVPGLLFTTTASGEVEFVNRTLQEYFGRTLDELTDLEDLRRTQEKLRTTQAQLSGATHLATMSELSASIAHEVNQPLSAVLTNGHACERWLSTSPPNLKRAMLSAERIVRDANCAAEVMGLVIYRSIVEAHGGRLWAARNAPYGARFGFALHAARSEQA